jgi:hypothetical protein
MQFLWNWGAYQSQVLEERSFANAWENQTKRDKKKSAEKAGAGVEEEHLLLFVDMCDNIIFDTGAFFCIQMDIQDAYVSTPIVTIDCGFANKTDDKDHLD